VVAFEVIAPKMESSSINVVLVRPSLVGFRKWVNPSLGGTTRNHLEEWLKNQKQPNHFSRPFLLNVFIAINYYFFMFINYMF
jgi:hypothetical protein